MALVDGLGQGNPAEWIAALVAVLEAAHGGHESDAAKALESITRAAGSTDLPYPVRQRLYQAAVTADRLDIARLFFSASPTTADPRHVARQTAPERALELRSRPLTLGERKALARTHRREQLALIVKDPHPTVIAVLLGNPRVTEVDVVRIAAARQSVPESLAMIADHPGWSARYAVKRALVLNPGTPLAIAIRIATTLTSRDLNEINQLSILPQPLRDHALDLLQRRRRPTLLS